ncbi:MAG TPA: TonB-dependent receptor [Candidatus Angelobacter sp.]|nr:TonB-dependent receptor [Candidatus Angelobacter sp.]
MMRSAAQLGTLVLLCAGLIFSQPASRTLQGTVRDQQGYVVANARVSAQGSGYERSTTTRNDGSFSLQGAPAGKVTIAVEARGFAPFTIAAPEVNQPIEVVLSPASVAQEINVTANRAGTSLGETAESVEILPRRQLETVSAESVDQALRLVPGFTLFRRSDSRTANPTSQGASLRGVGGNGASRTIVLLDDVPLNDPFGGWVYWGRIPVEDIASIEVLRGGGSSLYGSGAMSGVVNIVPERARNLASAEFSMGSADTPYLSLVTDRRLHSWTLGTSGEFFRSNGYILVPSDTRGAVDTPANSSHGDGHAIARRALSQGDIFFGGEFYDESRHNGTPLQTNDTQLWQVTTGLNVATPLTGVQLRGFGSGQSYNQSFSSIALDRNSEALTRLQHVPAQQLGASFALTRQIGSRNSLVAGADVRSVRGFSNETAVAGGIFTSLVDSGGRQLTTGAFVQDSLRLLPRLLFTFGGRYDSWDNYQAHTSTMPLVPTVKPAFTGFAAESDHAFSPRAALLFAAGNHVTLTASAYQSFRAPTLNELYRSFRLGNVLTLANSGLMAERLTGAEGGANIFLGATRLHAGFFWMQVSDPVANVTLTTTPALITRQRQNLGQTRSQGVEADAAWRLRRLDIIAGYQFVDAVVTSFPGNAALVGLNVPQVPAHLFTVQTRYSLPRGWTVAAQARASSRQFDDDLNQFPLDSFFQLDAYVSRRLAHGVELFAAAENLTDSRVQVARTPTLNVGPPIFGRAGVKFRWE